MQLIRDYFEDGICPDCGSQIPDYMQNGEHCHCCGYIFNVFGYDKDFVSKAVQYALANMDDFNEAFETNLRHEDVIHNTPTLNFIEEQVVGDNKTVALFKDPESDAIVGLDSSHVDHEGNGFYADPYNPGRLLYVAR